MPIRKDLDFKNFEAILQAQRKKIEKNIEVVKAEVEGLRRQDAIGDFADISEIQIDNTRDQTLLYQLEEEIIEVDAALGRIEDGTYGICEDTSEPIPKERLIANPLARTVVSK